MRRVRIANLEAVVPPRHVLDCVAACYLVMSGVVCAFGFLALIRFLKIPA